MKPMLDNEIDNLFKSSFEDYQLKPSGESWKKISSKLADKSGNGNRYYWLVAASIILLFSIVIRFYGNADKVIKLSADAPNDEDAGVVLAVNKPKKVIPLKILTLEEVRLNNEKIFLKLIGETDTSLEHKGQLENNIDQENFLADNAVTTNNAKREKEELYPKYSRAADVTVRDLINERVLGKEDTQSPNDLSAAAFHKGDSSAGKNKIKSVGDLVNFVIAKVDSRDQKLLHFSKTEESDVEITGINLGLFKYKKN